jgi:hypothetical protein
MLEQRTPAPIRLLTGIKNPWIPINGMDASKPQKKSLRAIWCTGIFYG